MLKRTNTPMRADICLLALVIMFLPTVSRAEDIGKLWPACKGWNARYGTGESYTPRELNAQEAQDSLARLTANEGKQSESDHLDAEIDSLNRLEGYVLRYRAESPSYDAQHHTRALKDFCRWITTHYMPE